MKTILFASLLVATSQYVEPNIAPKPDIQIMRYSDTSPTTDTSPIIGVVINKGFKIIHNIDGTESVYVSGKYLRKIIDETK